MEKWTPTARHLVAQATRPVLNGLAGPPCDELYAYDGLYRLADMQRGTLNAQKDAVTNKSFAQGWLLDATGNWDNFKQDADGNGTWDLNQNRTANPVNEITDITEMTGPSWATPAYSPVGNMTTMLQPAAPTASYAAVYDAWNRLVKLVEGANIVQENAYDGIRRRTFRKDYAGGSLDETRHFFYSAAWQVLEERLNGSTNPDRQFVWGPRYIDDLVCRDHDTNSDGTLDQRLYALQDANWNVVALTNTAGTVQERYVYQSYGPPLFLNAAFVPQSASGFDWTTLYCGYRYDSRSGLYLVRNRVLHPALGVWVQRDPFGHIDGMSLYAAYFVPERTDPNGTYAESTPSPHQLKTPGECKKWGKRCRQQAVNAYELPLRVRVEVGRACDDAETACVKRTVGPALYSHLITACCDDIKDECEKRRCAAEAKCIKDAAAKARDDIYSRGGPKRFKFHGPVCTDCEASVSDHMSKCKLGPSSFFDYSATGKVTWYRFGDHVWGKVVCRRTGKTVATIDIWKGEEEYFRPGEDSYGYKSTF